MKEINLWNVVTGYNRLNKYVDSKQVWTTQVGLTSNFESTCTADYKDLGVRTTLYMTIFLYFPITVHQWSLVRTKQLSKLADSFCQCLTAWLLYDKNVFLVKTDFIWESCFRMDSFQQQAFQESLFSLCSQQRNSIWLCSQTLLICTKN